MDEWMNVKGAKCLKSKSWSKCGRKKAAARVCVLHGGVHISGAWIDRSIELVWVHEYSLETVDYLFRHAVDKDAGGNWLYRTYVR